MFAAYTLVVLIYTGTGISHSITPNLMKEQCIEVGGALAAMAKGRTLQASFQCIKQPELLDLQNLK